MTTVACCITLVSILVTNLFACRWDQSEGSCEVWQDNLMRYINILQCVMHHFLSKIKENIISEAVMQWHSKISWDFVSVCLLSVVLIFFSLSCCHIPTRTFGERQTNFISRTNKFSTIEGRSSWQPLVTLRHFEVSKLCVANVAEHAGQCSYITTSLDDQVSRRWFVRQKECTAPWLISISSLAIFLFWRLISKLIDIIVAFWWLI